MKPECAVWSTRQPRMRRAQASLNEEGQKTVRWVVFPMKAAWMNPLQVAMEVKSWSMGLGPIAPSGIGVVA